MKKINGVILLDGSNLNTPIPYTDSGVISGDYHGFLSSMSRVLGPMIVNDTVQSIGIPSTVINYVDFWSLDDIDTFVGNWIEKNNVTHGCFGVSSLFNMDYALRHGTTLNNIVLYLKNKYPTFKFIAGGPAYSFVSRDHLTWHPDAIFSSNGSMFLFKKWLLGEEIDSQFCQVVNGIPEYRTPLAVNAKDVPNAVLEKPIVPILHDDYCLTDKDTLSFEVRKGCKFNCSFCSYEFRHAKNVNDVEADKLSNFFSTAVNKYNIRTFSIVDDTANEEDIKLEIMLDAVKDLPPITIGGFARLDLFASRPQQIDLCNKIGFTEHLYGIETLGTDAARKGIGKGGSKERLYEVLETLKNDYSHWYRFGSFMAGLPNDDPDEFYYGLKYAIDNKLVQGHLLNAFYLYNLDTWKGQPTMLNSKIQLNPDKYGIVPHPEYTYIFKNGWNREQVEKSKIVTRLSNYAHKNGISSITPFTAQILKGLGWDHSANNFFNLHDMVANPNTHLKQIAKLRDAKVARYINDKLATVAS